jgi:nucleoside-diphosphate-sugar epimerase
VRVFLTGATGFIGTAVARNLLASGHSVLGVARTDEGARALTDLAVEPHRGDLTDHASFIAGAQACDAVIHCAFIHDFSRFIENIEIEQQTVIAMLDALAGSGKPFIATSGVAMLAPGRVATEEDRPQPWGRGATETLVLDAASRGLRTSIIRLPPITHDSGSGGFLPALVQIAREKGVAAYVGDGENRWPAVHRLDAADLYRLALEKGVPGSPFMAVADAGLPMRAIAEAIGRRLGLPTASVSPDDAPAHFGWLGMFVGVDMPASSQITRDRLNWQPTKPGLIEDIDTATLLGGQALA